MRQTKNFILKKAEEGRTEWKHAFLLSLFIFTIILILPIGNAKIISVIEHVHGLHINSWDIENIQQNKPYTFVWDVDQDGMLLYNNQTNCSFFLIKSGTAVQLSSGYATPTPDKYGWYKTIPGSSFSTTGQYNYQIDCFMVSNSSVSGNLLGIFNVTPSGEINNTDIYYVLIALFYTIAFIGFFGKNEWVTMFGGMALIPLGLFMINSGVFTFRNTITDVLSWTTIGLGAFFVIYSGIEIIKENL